ncbi:MAG: acyltransferase family protein [Ilumatobacteraceae bacterium]
MSRTERIGHQPALDGLRAVSVVLVLLFHQGFTWMGGGYVGVSVFFTLSGFLITTLLVLEHERHGTISARAFYSRRVRRLLPASLLCISGVAIAARAGAFPPVDRLDRALLGALGQVANWEALSRHASYASLLTGGATPVDHFWSLAVEEQFYWLWPLGAALIFRLWRSHRHRTAAVCTTAAFFVLLGPLVAARWGGDVAYLATPSRLGEILTGASLAMLIGAHPVRAFDRRRWLGDGVGWCALATIIVAAVVLPSDHGPAYAGLLGVGSILTVAVLATLQSPRSSLRRALSWRPLELLGRVSYGVYLYHWPVFLAIRPGDSSWTTFVLRAVLTLSAAAVSYVAVERYVRQRADGATRTFGVATIVAAAVAVVVVSVVPTGEPDYAADDASAVAVSMAPVDGTLAPLVTAAAATTTQPLSPSSSAGDGTTVLFDVDDVPRPSRPVRVLVLGDSTGLALGAGLIEWAADHPDVLQVTSLASIGCGIVRDGDLDIAPAVAARCRQTMTTDLPATLATSPPDVIVVFVSLIDAGPRVWDQQEGSLPSTDPRYVARLDASYDRFVRETLAASPAQILWLTPTPPADWFFGRVSIDYPLEWWDAENTAIDRADLLPRVHVADLGAWMTEREATGSHAYREDGLHLSVSGAVRLVDEELADGIVAVALGLLPDHE